MIKVFSKIKKYRKAIFFVVLLGIVFFSIRAVHADPSMDIANQTAQDMGIDTNNQASGLPMAIGSLVSWILSYVNYAVGRLLVFFLDILVKVASYNQFITAKPIEVGWVIVRDLCNMFFILVLLIIAFATILRIETYQWKKSLPKLLLMAVLINFSKTIAGLFIDFAQVIMLTFVSAFSQYGANNFVQMFQVEKYLSDSKTNLGTENLGYAILLGSVAGSVALIITTVVTVVLLAVLVMRIVMLWIYVILSPLAYLLGAFPQGQRYASQWWSEFSKQVISGPILAFFLWLALVTAQTQNPLGTDVSIGDATAQQFNRVASSSSVNAGTALFTTGPFQTYLVTIGLLVGGLIVTQQMGGMAGSLAGKGIGWAKKFSGATLAGAGAAALWKKSQEKAQDVTGVSAAKQYFANRREEKAKTRTDRIQSQANVIARGMTAAKQSTIGVVGTGMKELWGEFGANQAKNLHKQLGEERTALSSLKGRSGRTYEELKIANEGVAATEIGKGEAWLKGNRYTKSAGGDWVGMVDGSPQSLTEDQMKERLTSHHLEQNLESEITTREASIEEKKQRAEQFESRQKLADRVAKAGLFVGGGALGLATGGASVAAFGAGAAITYGTATAARDKITEAGKLDDKLVSKYRVDQIAKKKEGMKDDSVEEVLATLDDKSKDAFTRIAAAIEAKSRNELSTEQERHYWKELQKERALGGPKAGDGKELKDWGDKKVNSRWKAAFAKEAMDQQTVQAAISGDKDAQYKIHKQMAEGEVNFKKADVDTLSKTIDILARAVDNRKFSRDFKDMDSGRQAALIRALERSTTLEAKQKLAFATNIERAFGAGKAVPGSDKDKFIKGLTEDDWRVILSGTSEQLAAARDAVHGDMTVLAPNMRISETTLANRLRRTLSKGYGGGIGADGDDDDS